MLHCTALYYTALFCPALNRTIPHYAALHCAALRLLFYILSSYPCCIATHFPSQTSPYIFFLLSFSPPHLPLLLISSHTPSIPFPFLLFLSVWRSWFIPHSLSAAHACLHCTRTRNHRYGVVFNCVELVPLRALN